MLLVFVGLSAGALLIEVGLRLIGVSHEVFYRPDEFCGASLVLMPWGAWLVMQARRSDPSAGSLFGQSPASLRVTANAGVFGGLAYALLAYTGFVFAPATHASVLMPGSLPLWTAVLHNAGAALLVFVLVSLLARLRAPEA